MKETIKTDRAPKAIGPYSQAVRAGDFLFVSGQLGLDPATGEMVSDQAAVQAERILRSLRGVIEDSGATLMDVVKTTVFLADMDDFNAVNEVYGRFFDTEQPARSLIQAARLPKGARIEIEAIVWMGR